MDLFLRKSYHGLAITAAHYRTPKTINANDQQRSIGNGIT